MPWIELHSTIRNHPKVEMLCTELNIPKPEAIGHLACLWTWALEYVEDGDLSRYTPEIIERACEWKGDGRALFNCLVGKFIDKDLKLHNWLDYVERYLTGKYRTSKPKKLAEIKRKYKRNSRRTKSSLQSDFSRDKVVIPLPTLTNQINNKLYVSSQERKNNLNTNPEHQEIISFFNKVVLEKKGIKYLSDSGKDKSAVGSFLLQEDKPPYQDLISFFLRSDKSNQHVSLSACLSIDTINLFNLYQKKKQPGSVIERDMSAIYSQHEENNGLH